MRSIVAWCLGLAAGILVFPAAAALFRGGLVAPAIAVAVAGFVSFAVQRWPIVALDASAAPRGLRVVAAVAAALALVQLARAAVFTVDPARVACSSVPSSRWETRHSCVSAYFVAARAASTLPNVYADSLYTARDDDPSRPRKALTLGPFNVDVYEYPPPFLLLPRALRLVTPTFMRFRMLWFTLDAGLILLAFLIVARRLGPAAGTRALLLMPLVWIALPTTSMLQKGNAQGMVIAASMVAMILFETRRGAVLGGALLAFLTLSKLYPGMLLVWLVAARRWRALAWTLGLGAALVAVSVLDTGWGPYAAFRAHLPGLMSGEAFPAFRNPAAAAINFSVPGLVFKLKLFGVAGMGFAAMKAVGWIYTLVAVGVAAWVGATPLRADQRPLAWLAILIVATLRSPFLPQAYAAFPSLWLLTLVAALRAPNVGTLAATLLAWAALNVFWPQDWPLDPRVLAIASGLPQALTIALAVIVIREALAARPRGSLAVLPTAVP